jgi:hypothetical protein
MVATAFSGGTWALASDGISTNKGRAARRNRRVIGFSEGLRQAGDALSIRSRGPDRKKRRISTQRMQRNTEETKKSRESWGVAG